MQPGELIAGKYRIERLLGAGGMGSVYVANNEVLQKRVALKVMSDGFAKDQTAVQRFFREAMSASRVRHPAIVEIYDAGSHGMAPWMAMELLEGEALAARLERGPLALGEVLAVFVPVLSALHAVHAQGIVHRDLKPDNIFLERLPDGGVQPKLLDFGIAKAMEGPSRLTATGTVMGTAYYLAPEQARDSSMVDARSDLYAIGVVLYESLTGGRMPFSANTLPELISKLLTEDPAPLPSVAPHVPIALANVVHWCLARDPAGRPQTAAELATHLRQALAGIPEQAVAVGAGPASPRAVTRTADPPAAQALAALSPRTQPLPPTGGAPAYAPPSHAPPGTFDRPKKRGSARLWIALGVAAFLALGCAVAAPFALGVWGYSRAVQGGGTGFASAWPRMWETWRAPILADVNGDGANDLIGWSQQIISLDLHELLCAYDGQSGEELWCADVGEQESIGDTQTVLAAGHVVYLDHRGRARAFALSSGEALGWSASVRGKPEEVCALGGGRIAVRTSDALWSVLEVESGAVSLAGEVRPAGCAPVTTTEPPRGLSLKVSAGPWERAPAKRSVAMRMAGETFNVREVLESDAGELLLLGVARSRARSPGMIGLVRSGALAWHSLVPTDPVVAQAQPPEGAALTDEVAYVTYELTARGDVPRRAAAFRIADGARLWDVGLPEARGRAVDYLLTDGRVVVYAINHQLFVHDAATGQPLFRIGEPPRSR